MSEIADHWNYYLVIILMMLGFYAVIARGNMVKKMVGLNIFQTSVFMLYISVGKIDGCLLYTSPSPRDMRRSRMPSSA